MSPKTPTLAAVIKEAIANRLADVHVMLPGKIQSYDATTQTADVEPMIKRFQEGADGETIDEAYPVIPNVPVVFPRAGGYKITFPVEPGDFCMLKFCESSIDVYQSGSGDRPASPDVFQRFDLTDAVAILGWYPSGASLSQTDGDDLVMGKDGGAVIHIANDQVNLYEKTAADFVALAQKVLDELNVAKTDRASYKTTFDAHTHPYVDTPAGPSVTSPTTTPFQAPTEPSSVAAAKVKAT
jgi:hypothetical protein